MCIKETTTTQLLSFLHFHNQSLVVHCLRDPRIKWLLTWEHRLWRNVEVKLWPAYCVLFWKGGGSVLLWYCVGLPVLCDLLRWNLRGSAAATEKIELIPIDSAAARRAASGPLLIRAAARPVGMLTLIRMEAICNGYRAAAVPRPFRVQWKSRVTVQALLTISQYHIQPHFKKPEQTL